MSAPPVRRKDKLMSDEQALEFLARGWCGRIASVGADGWPYCVPLLYVWADGEVRVHNPAARGHFRANVEHNPRVCFEVDEPDQVFDYGRFECDSGLAYSSVILFGRICVVDERDVKQRFCEMLMQKYGKPDTGRPKGFFPRLDIITVYAITVERITGKECALPAQQWPEVDFTRTPNARAP